MSRHTLRERSGNRRLDTFDTQPTALVPGAPVNTAANEQHGEANEVLGTVLLGGEALGNMGSGNDYSASMEKADNRTWSGHQMGSEAVQNNMTYAGSAFTTFNLVADVSNTIQMFYDKNTSPQDRAGAVLSNVGSASATAGAFANVTKASQGGDLAPAVTQAAANVLAEITGILSTIKAGYELVKQIVELILEADDLEDDAMGGRIVLIVKSALEAGKSTIETINAFMSHLGKATGPMLQAAPGIGIAMGALEVICQGINIGYSYVSWSEMREDKGASKAALGVPKGAKPWYKFGFGNPSGQGDADAILAQRASLKASKNEKELAYQAAEEALTRKPGDAKLKKARDTALKDFETAKGKADAVKEKNRIAKDYVLAKNLQRVAAKRIRRGALNISTALPGIAGDIAVLSGVGAAVGGGLKAAGSGAKLLAVGFRMLKQAYHDAGHGDQTKSTVAKEATYDSLIHGITKSVVKANDATSYDRIIDPDVTVQQTKRAQAKEAAQTKALNRVLASGMTPAKMNQHKADPGKLYNEWMSALKKRD